MKFSDRLREARTQKGLTQAEIAEKLGITRTTIINWEKGVTTPDREEVEKLSKAFDTDLVKFLHQENVSEANEPTVEYGLVDKMIKTYESALASKEEEILRLVEDKKWLKDHINELTVRISPTQKA